MNELISNFHFIRPLALLALPVVLFILWHMQRNDSGDDGWSKICDPHLLDAIKIKRGGNGSRWSLLLWPICIIAITAIAGPAYKKMPTPTIKNQSALVIALDVSKSMLADDIKPNRLARAKFKINDILAKRKDGQTALLVYSGDAFVVTPLTDDTETIALMLKALNPDIMPVQGSRVDIALSKAQDLLQQAGYRSGDVLLISDGVSSQANNAAETLQSNNINVSVLGVGTLDGAPIPLKTGFLKDRSGNIVIPKLDISALRSLSSSGNGRFAQITGDSKDIDFVLPTQVENGDEPLQTDDESSTEKYRDEGPWLTLLLIPLFALLFRKGMLLGLFFVIGLQSPQPSYALDYDDLWLNSDQKAAKLLQNGQHEAAFESAKSDQWKASAAFRKKDYQQAKDLFNDGTADGFYNQGNTLAMSGQLEEALKSYESSLAMRPDDEDTLYNKEQVEQALEQQQKQDQENKDKQDQENKDQDKQDQDQEKQDSEENQDQQEQQEGEGEDQEGENKDQGDNPEQQEKDAEQGEMTDEEKKKQEEEQKKLEQADKEEQEKQQQDKQQEVKLTPEEMAENAENKEAIEQWLRRIPDDPGGLLRRKFYYQYNQQNKKPDETEDW